MDLSPEITTDAVVRGGVLGRVCAANPADLALGRAARASTIGHTLREVGQGPQVLVEF